jgi:hypothetical protein
MRYAFDVDVHFGWYALIIVRLDHVLVLITAMVDARLPNAQCRMLQARCSILDAPYSTLDSRCSTLDQYSYGRD